MILEENKEPQTVCFAFDSYNMQTNGRMLKTLNSAATDTDHIPVVCFEPEIAKREGSENRFSIEKCGTLRANMGDNQPAVCYPINLMVATRDGRDDMRTCFGVDEPGDPQFTLSAAHEHGVCYAIEGNIVDRVSAKNGKGWCEDVSPTLNTQDRHAVVFDTEGNGARPSHMGKDMDEQIAFMAVANTNSNAAILDDGTVPTLLGVRGQHGEIPFVLIGNEDDGDPQFTLSSAHEHDVCYEISAGEVRKGKAEVCQTLRSRMGTGGGNVPILIMDMTRRDRVDVKPPDKAPTMQCTMGSGGGNVPVVMIKDEADGIISQSNRCVMCE